MSRTGHCLKLIYLTLFMVIAYFAITFPVYAGEKNSKKSYAAKQAVIQAEFDLVKAVQRKLLKNGYDPGPIDGWNGSGTKKALESYQQDNGLKVDGVIGPITLKSLGINLKNFGVK